MAINDKLQNVEQFLLKLLKSSGTRVDADLQMQNLEKRKEDRIKKSPHTGECHKVDYMGGLNHESSSFPFIIYLSISVYKNIVQILIVRYYAQVGLEVSVFTNNETNK